MSQGTDDVCAQGNLPRAVREETEIHGRGGGQVGRAADEHSCAQGGKRQKQAGNVGTNFSQNTLKLE